jgi:hypothetical protein
VNNASQGESGFSNVVRIDTRSGKKIEEWRAEEKNCLLGHFTRSGGKVFVSTQRFRLDQEERFHQLWKARKYSEANQLKVPVASATYCLDGGRLAAVPTLGDSFEWQVSGFSIAASLDDRFVAVTFGPSHSLGIIDGVEKKMSQRVKFPAEVNSVSPSPEGGFLVGTADGVVWSVETNTWQSRKLVQAGASDHSFLI